MKLSKTQQRVYDDAKHTVEVIKKYATIEDFFDNSKNEQNTLTTACHCNNLFNSSEKYKAADPDGWERLSNAFKKIKYDNTLIVYAKTETVKAIERTGLIQIVREAKDNYGFELIKVL